MFTAGLKTTARPVIKLPGLFVEKRVLINSNRKHHRTAPHSTAAGKKKGPARTVACQRMHFASFYLTLSIRYASRAGPSSLHPTPFFRFRRLLLRETSLVPSTPPPPPLSIIWAFFSFAGVSIRPYIIACFSRGRSEFSSRWVHFQNAERYELVFSAFG